MLGYSEDDLNKMIENIQKADELLDTNSNPDIHAGLLLANDFLQGLWAEGYFDK